MPATYLSRRVAITGLCAAVAVPVSVKAAANPDAELLQLGKELDQLLAAEADALRRARPNWDAWQRAVRQFGERHAAGEGHITDEEYIAAGQKIDRQFPIAFPTPDDVTDAIDPIARRIMALPAHTLAGLVVKAKLAKNGCSHFWKASFEDADWDHKVARTLIDEVLQLGAVQS